MGYTDTEKQEILAGVPEDVKNRARQGDRDAIDLIKGKISEWKSVTELPQTQTQAPKTLSDRSRVIDLANQDNFNWDEISGLIDSGKLTDEVVEFFASEGYGLEQSLTGGRIINIGKKGNYISSPQGRMLSKLGESISSVVTIPWRGLGDNDPTSMSKDDFYRYLLKQPKDDWARTGVEKLIRKQLQERQQEEQKAYALHGEDANVDMHGKAGALSQKNEIPAPTPQDWFPEKFLKSEDGSYSANKSELKRYKSVILENDPYAASQVEQLTGRAVADFYYAKKEEDSQMLERLNQLQAEGRTHLHDPEVYDWFVRRGMEKTQDITLGQAIDAGWDILGQVWQGLVGSEDGSGIIKEFGDTVFKDDAAEYQEFDELVGESFRALGSDYQLLSENAGGYFLDLIEKADDKDSPEAQELYRKAKSERNRKFQLRALSNQAVYARASQSLALSQGKNPQQMQKNILTGTFTFDPMNFVPMGGVSKKGAEATLRAGVNTLNDGALKTAKIAADEASKAISDAQKVLIDAKKAGDGAAIQSAKKTYDDALKQYDNAEKALKEASTKVDNIYQELLEAGMPKLSGKALEMMGAAGEWIMKKGDEALDNIAVKIAPGMADDTRRLLEGGVKVGVAATLGGASLGTVGAVVGGVLLGSPVARALARDMRLMGSHIALGARLQPLHRALQATTDAGGNVISPASFGTRVAARGYEAAFPFVDPVARLGSRVVKGVASVQTAEAMAIQSAIGYLGSGGTWQGAVTGATMGFGMAGSFGAAGALTPFGSQKQVNQLAATNARHYRDMLKGTPTGDEFAKLPFEDQKAIAWAMGGFTDTALKIINDPNAPAGAYNPARNEININTGRREWTKEFARNVAKHEHSHYIARHVGVREKILKTLLADDFSLQSGIFAKKGKDGKALYKLDRDTIREIMRKNTQGKSVDEVMQELGLSREAVESLGQVLTVGDRRRNDVYIETTDDFKDITNTYLSKLAASNPFAAIDLINKGERYVQEYIAEEIFAEQGAAEIANYTPAYAKSFRRAAWRKDLDAALSNPRFSGRKASVLGRIGALFGSDQKINSSILGAFDSIPEFKEIFDGYNHSRSMNRDMQLAESNADGLAPSEILDPRDWDASVSTPSTESLKAWVANGMLDVDPKTGVPKGIEVQADGSWRVRDPNLIRQSAKNADKAAKEFGSEIKDWLEDNTQPPKSAQEIKDSIDSQAPPRSQAEKDALDEVKKKIDGGVKQDIEKEIRVQKSQSVQATKDYLDDVSQIIDDNMADDDVVAPRTTIDGRTIIAGRYLPEDLLTHLEKSGRFNPHQLQNLRNLNQYLKDGLHATPITVMYQSTMRAGKAKPIAAAEKTVYVTGFEVTQQGNFIYRIWNIDKIMTNGAKKMNSKIGKQLYNGDIGQFNQDVYTYFNNYAKGLPGATGLSATKRDFIRKAIGLADPNTSSNSGRTPNPYAWNVQPLKDAKDTALNSYRLDRTNWIDLGNPRMKKPLDAPLTSREGPNPGSYQRIRENYHPGDIDYLDAVESGDMETAQKMVDEAAKKAGWTVLAWHGTTQGALKGNKFDPSKQQRGFITSAGYFTTDKRAAAGYATSGGAGHYPKGSKERKALEGGERPYDPSLYRVYLKGDWWKGDIDTDALVEAVNTVNNKGIADEFDLEWTSTWDDKEGYASRTDSYPDVVFDTPEEWLRDFVEKGEFDSYVGNDTDAIGSESPIAFVFSNWEVGKEYLNITKKDGVTYFDKETTEVDAFSDNATTYVPTNPNQIKSADPVTYDDAGSVIPLSERFNPKSDDIRYHPGTDSDYLKAVESGDTETAQKMVDEAAKAAGYKVVYHGTTKKGYTNIWKSGKLKPDAEPAVYVTTDSEGGGYGDGTVLRIGIKEGRLEIDDEFPGGREDYRVEVGYQGEIQIKSADPVTYDDAGNVIPLSERFNPKSDDIRFFPGLDDESTKRAGFNFTAVSDRIPVIRDLYAKKDWEGLREINRSLISHALADIPRSKLKVTTEDIHGVWMGETEPTIRVEVEAADDATLDQARRRINALGAIFDQDEVHEFQRASMGDNDQFGVTPGAVDQFQPFARIFVEDPSNPGRKLDWSELEPYRAQTDLLGASFDGNEIFVYGVDGNEKVFLQNVKKLEQLIQNGNLSRIQKTSEYGAIRLRRASRDMGRPETRGYQESAFSDGPVSQEGQPGDKGLRSDLALRVLKFTGGRILSPKDAKRSLFVGKDLTPEQVELQIKIADHYEQAPVNDMDRPIVQRAYRALQKELVDQYKAIVEGMEIIGVPWRRKKDGEWIEGDIYPSSKEAVRDIRQNNRMEYLLTDPDAFGPQGEDFSGHPLLEDSGIEVMLQDAETGELRPYSANYNDILRVVHDVIAHGLYTDQFGPIGEEGAYRTHAVVTQDPFAIWTLANETRNQNSWVNYGPQVRGKDGQLIKKGEPGFRSIPEREFAEQKAILLPVDDLLTGVPEIDQKVESLRAMLTPEEAMGSLAESSQVRYYPGTDDDAIRTSSKNILTNQSSKGTVNEIGEAATIFKESFIEQFGEVMTAKDMGDDQIKWLADQLVQEALVEFDKVDNAVDWYTTAVEGMLKKAETLFPEISDRGIDYHTFLAAVAITSQNLAVRDNLAYAVGQYEYRKKNGVFNYKEDVGSKAEAIRGNLKLFDRLIKELGEEDYIQFTQRDFTIKELSSDLSEVLGKKVNIAGYQSDSVKGSAAFGPKIGQGFLQNLLGNYDPVTVDLWLRRTFGRLTGDAIRKELTVQDIGRLVFAFKNRSNRGKFKLPEDINLPDYLKGLRLEGSVTKRGSQHKITGSAFSRLFNPKTKEGAARQEELRQLGKVLNSAWESTYKREVPKLGKEEVGKRKPYWAYIGSTLNGKFKPVDAPSNLERKVITQAFEIVRKRLKEEHDLDFTNADLQALLWYPEKDIWGHLTGESADSLKEDYSTAMEAILNERNRATGTE